MSYNLNSEYGQSIASSLPLALNGKVHVVAESSVSNLNMLEQIFHPDYDGDIRFHSSLEDALDHCTANAGDVILLAAGHSETVSSAAAVDVDVAGVKILGLGQGSDRPSFSMDTVVGASFKVSAANVHIENVVFEGGVDALTNPVNIVAADCTLKDVETKDVTGQTVDFIVTDDNADRLTIDGWTHRGASAAGAATAISIVGGDNAHIRNFHIDGNFSTAAIENVTTAADDITIEGGDGASFIYNRNSADVLITLVSTATGFVGPNIYGRVADNAANITEAVVIGDAVGFDPIYIANNDGERGVQWNASASTDA